MLRDNVGKMKGNNHNNKKQNKQNNHNNHNHPKHNYGNKSHNSIWNAQGPKVIFGLVFA